MKIMLTSVCAAALLAGCATEDGRYGSQTDIYRDDWAAPTYRVSPEQERYVSRRALERPITAREPEQVEITRTEQAMALRQRALRHQSTTSGFEGLAYRDESNTIPIPSGSVNVAFRRQQQIQALSQPSLPMEVSDPALLPVAERFRTRSPVATGVPGRPGYVISPFSPGSGYVDVSGLPPGSQARDPFTGRVFTVP